MGVLFLPWGLWGLCLGPGKPASGQLGTWANNFLLGVTHTHTQKSHNNQKQGFLGESSFDCVSALGFHR